MSFPQPTPMAQPREHVDEVKGNISLTPTGEGNESDDSIDTVTHVSMDPEEIEYTAEEHRKLLRKIDWRIVPLAAWACGLQFVDKSGLGAAATYGLRDDLNLVGQEYSWYTQEEQPLRFGLWTVTNGALPVPFLVIYYGLGHVTTGPITSWRLIFLTIGLLSSLTGVLMFILMPDAPQSAKWLSGRERAIAVKRVAQAQLGLKNTHFKWEQVQETLRDPHAWLLILQMFFSQTAGSVTTNFLGIVIKGFGYTALKAQLYTAPNYAVQAAVQLLVSALPTFFVFFRNKKQPLAVFASIVGVIGIIILYVTPPEDQYQTRRLAGCIIISSSGVNYTVIMSIIGANFVGFTRKQTVTSAAFFLYCVANIITPQTFLGKESPQYHTGLAFVLACLSIYIILSTATWVCMRLENNCRESRARENPEYASSVEGMTLLSGLEDQTDIQNKRFRYSG
ncbi:Major facilitator superfamily domain general substrate transporter [Penicillium fimorum]|uniref:Major facilitator superfamily domain general substrate transporter n=1 Tax=Penicillium fimorum TaxID=1882269 RepID=A0A9X0C5R7_9EURO|nr:Major facilitator superfamily domain general substrate transporter [Penicillium fimorum]